MESENQVTHKKGEPKQKYKFGFVALVGRPNTGKSTLVNTLLKQKISITANKPQTTRTNIRGFLTRDDYQAVLVDTPGIHQPANSLHKKIVSMAVKQIECSDLILFITEPYLPKGEISEEDSQVIKYLKKTGTPVFMLINKMDIHSPEETFRFMDKIPKEFNFRESFSISALKGKGTDIMLDKLVKYLPEGNRLYPEDMVTDSTMREISGEIIRESVFRLIHKEIPYSTAVVIESFQEFPGLTRIFATIMVGKESQKVILIGKNGMMLKKIGTSARVKIQMMTLNTVFLDLKIKVAGNWFNNDKQLTEFGYDVS